MQLRRTIIPGRRSVFRPWSPGHPSRLRVDADADCRSSSSCFLAGSGRLPRSGRDTRYGANRCSPRHHFFAMSTSGVRSVTRLPVRNVYRSSVIPFSGARSETLLEARSRDDIPLQVRQWGEVRHPVLGEVEPCSFPRPASGSRASIWLPLRCSEPSLSSFSSPARDAIWLWLSSRYCSFTRGRAGPGP